MIRRRALVVGAALSLVLGTACRKREKTERVTAHFGVLFGGQIQEREEIPLILDRSRLALVVRVEWAEPPATAERVHWELAQPASPKDADAGSIVAYGDARARPGEPTLDVPLAFKPGDKSSTRKFSWRQGTDAALTLAAYGAPVLALDITYDPNRFSRRTVAAMLGHLETLLLQIAGRPQARLAEINLLTGDERRWLLKECNDNAADFQLLTPSDPQNLASAPTPGRRGSHADRDQP